MECFVLLDTHLDSIKNQIETRSQHIEFGSTEMPTTYASMGNFNLTSNLTITEIIELLGALFHTGYIKGEKKDMWEWGSKVFEIELNQPESTLIKGRNRKIDNTKFLSKLLTDYKSFCNSKL